MRFCTLLVCIVSFFAPTFIGCADSEPSVIVAPEESEADILARRQADDAASREAIKSLEAKSR